jgi:hypothetical protein
MNSNHAKLHTFELNVLAASKSVSGSQKKKSKHKN